ncbi:MAG: molybdenum cofactor biosynthesis protein MoaE [Thermoplasmatota archaeon]
MDEKVVVTKEDFDLEQLKRDLMTKESGAAVIFNGVVRGFNEGEKVESLELERYDGMTIKELENIREEGLNRFEIDDIFIIHRFGELDVKDNIVGIIVTSPHRKAGFEACEYVIDKIKEKVPLWKKENTVESGEHWLEGQD